MGRNDQSTELTREELYTQVWAEPMTNIPGLTRVRPTWLNVA